MRRIGIFRRICQLAVVALFCALPWLAANGFNSISGSLFQFDFFGLPFADPANALQVLAQYGALGFSGGAMLCLGAFIALLIAFLLGRIFCGWLCPYGFFSEISYSLNGIIYKRNENAAKEPKIGFWCRIAILAFVILAGVFLGFPVIGIISFPGELSIAPLAIWNAESSLLWVSLLLACWLPAMILCVELIVGKRFWCIFACPQSALLALAAWALPKKAPGLRIAWQAQKCSCEKLSPCRKACSINLNPRKKGGPKRRDCLMCGACLQTCQNYGKALEWTVSPNKEK